MLEMKAVGGQGGGAGKAQATLGHAVVGPGKPGRRGGCGRGGLGDGKINNERPRVCVGRVAVGSSGAGLPAKVAWGDGLREPGRAGRVDTLLSPARVSAEAARVTPRTRGSLWACPIRAPRRTPVAATRMYRGRLRRRPRTSPNVAGAGWSGTGSPWTGNRLPVQPRGGSDEKMEGRPPQQ